MMSGFKASFSRNNFMMAAGDRRQAPNTFERAKPEEKPLGQAAPARAEPDFKPFTQNAEDAAMLARRLRQTRIMIDATRDLSDNPRPSAREIDAYKELFYQFADRLLPADLRLISAMLARSAYTPRPVALYLANDSADIAAPILLYSPVLDRADLRAIANKKGSGHRKAIARRMAEAGETSFKATKENPLPAVLSTEMQQADTRTAAQTAPEQKADTAAVKAATLEEALLPGRFERLQKHPQHALQTNGESEAPETADMVPATFDGTTAKRENATLTNTERELLSLAGRGGRFGSGKQDASSPRNDGKENLPVAGEADKEPSSTAGPVSVRRYDTLPMRESDELIALARRRDFSAVARQIAGYSGLGETPVLKLLRAQKGDEIVYLTRALNLPRAKELSFLLALQPRFSRGPERLAETRSLLSELDTGICRIIFNQIGADFALPELETVKLSAAAPTNRQSAETSRTAAPVSATKPSADGTEDFYRTLHQRRASVVQAGPSVATREDEARTAAG